MEAASMMQRHGFRSARKHVVNVRKDLQMRAGRRSKRNFKPAQKRRTADDRTRKAAASIRVSSSETRPCVIPQLLGSPGILAKVSSYAWRLKLKKQVELGRKQRCRDGRAFLASSELLNGELGPSEGFGALTGIKTG